MTQEDKELLLKDLCARLPYGVIIQEYNEEYGYSNNTLNTIGIGYFSIHEASVEGTWINHIENIKPYLRPISSMTEEEKFELSRILSIEHEDYLLVVEVPDIVDFYNQNHLDYRRLIERGLALEALKDMYK